MLNYLKAQLSQLKNDERGVTTVEYAVMIGLVALAVAIAVPGISDAVLDIFGAISTALTNLLP